jgi:N-acetylmuramoyl-L-alanine amidase
MAPLVTAKLLKRNFTPGRDMYPDMLVIHVTEGDAGSVIAWFNDPASQVSAHYMVQRDGQIIQFVHDEDRAWHAGNVVRPTAKLVLDRPGVSPNRYSIGIEHEGDGTQELTPAQRTASLDLLWQLSQRWKIPVDRDHIVGHHEIRASKTCPGGISVDRLVREMLGTHGAPPAHPAAPKLVWSDYHTDWLIVVREISDTEWYFVPLKTLRAKNAPTQRADTPLSQMPR